MVNYKKSVSAVALSATLVAAQSQVNSTVIGDTGNGVNNGNQFVNLNQTNNGGVQLNFNDIVNGDKVGGDKTEAGHSGQGQDYDWESGTHEWDEYGFDYTTVIPGLKPTGGWVDHTYTFHQVCPTPCGKPEVPLGWEYTTTVCEVGCGPKPTPVKVLQAPWGPPPFDCQDHDDECKQKLPVPKPAEHEPIAPCPTCHINVVEYCPPPSAECEDDSCIPEPVKYSTVVQQPTTLPQPPKDCEVCKTPIVPPVGPAAPPVGPAAPPVGPAAPPVGPAAPPVGPASPPVGPASPPVGPASPPVGPASPPVGPASPPVGPASPPVGPAAPPVGPAAPAGPNDSPVAPACVDCVPGNDSMAVPPVGSGSNEKQIATVATLLMACGVAVAALL